MVTLCYTALLLNCLVKNQTTYTKTSLPKDFTLDKCTVELEGLIEQVKDIDESYCQMYCNIIYPGRCKFFIYDRKQRICSLLDGNIDDYVETCSKTAGPKTPSYVDCSANTDPCQVVTSAISLKLIKSYTTFESTFD